MDSWERFNETTLPNKKAFYSKLYLEDIADEDYIHAQKVFEEFKLKNICSISMIYMFKAIHYCLKMYFKILEVNVLNYMNLILLIFLPAPGLVWQAYLKKERVKSELLTNNDMLMMVEKGIRGGIYPAVHRYVKANNKYMQNYNKNIESSYLMYLDTNNLYGRQCFKNYLKMVLNGKKKLSKFDEELEK